MEKGMVSKNGKGAEGRGEPEKRDNQSASDKREGPLRPHAGGNPRGSGRGETKVFSTIERGGTGRPAGVTKPDKKLPSGKEAAGRREKKNTRRTEKKEGPHV